MKMETKRADLRLNLPHFVEPSSGSWIPRSQLFMDSAETTTCGNKFSHQFLATGTNDGAVDKKQ